MTLRVWAAVLTLFAGGCEMLDETYVAESETMLEGEGVRIFEDLERDAWGGATLQYRASNSNDFPICVQVTLDEGAQTSGHSMGRIIRIPGGQTTEIGYVVPPARFDLSSHFWSPQDNGECGYPPS
jgi:hypothetical protein